MMKKLIHKRILITYLQTNYHRINKQDNHKYLKITKILFSAL
jgi:hypothetical protein